mgnify:CR=1 FL=1
MSHPIDSTPRQDGFHMPAEWARHRQTWMLWPERPDNWRLGGEPAQKAFSAVASAIARFEPVTMGVNPAQYSHARQMLPPQVRVVELPNNDAWMRDCGPTFVINQQGEARVVDWISVPLGVATLKDQFADVDDDAAVRMILEKWIHFENHDVDLSKNGAEAVDRLTKTKYDLVFLDLQMPELTGDQVLGRLKELDLLTAIHAELGWDARQVQAMNAVLRGELDPIWRLPERMGSLDIRRALGYLVWLAPLPAVDAGAIAQRLRLNQSISAALVSAEPLRRVLNALRGARPSQVVAALQSESPALIYVLRLLLDDRESIEMLENFATTWRQVQPSISGHDLQRRGIQPGPIYRQTLWRLRAAWLDGEIHTPEEEENLLGRILTELK